MNLGRILITGSSRGIGLEFVKQLVAFSPPPKLIFAACRDPDNAKELQEVKKKFSSNVHLLKLDVTSSDSVRKAVDLVEAIVNDQGLNILINNAGIYCDATFNDSTEKEMVDHFKTNALGAFLCTQGFLPLLRKAASNQYSEKMSLERAAVVNISSSLGSVETVSANGSRAAAYSVSKAAMNMITRKTAMEVRDEGIMAVALHPGYVATDMTKHQGTTKSVDSVLGMLKVLSKLEETGCFFTHTGKRLPW